MTFKARFVLLIALALLLVALIVGLARWTGLRSQNAQPSLSQSASGAL